MPRFNQTFTYDAFNRLLGANTAFGTFDYTYDDVGNRLTRTLNGEVDTYTYQPGTNRVAQITGANPAAFSYDAAGNITDIDGRTFVYNQNNRLIRVEGVSGILGEYTYNGFGQREIKEVDGVATIFHYDFDGNIIAESLPAGTINAEYLYVDQSRMAMVESDTGNLYFYHNNYLGTPVLMTDATGTVVWEADYKPFGEASVNPHSAVVNNFRFAGQYYDSETGLHYNYHRYYDPKTGRYLTPDPIGLLGGINLYVYANLNPINLIDPLGLRALTAGEITLAREIFGNTIDYSKVDIRQERFAGLIPVPEQRAMTPAGNIYFHPNNRYYRDDFSRVSVDLQGLFIHEMTHVWQHQSDVPVWFRGIYERNYTYDLDCDQSLGEYNIEQQGQILMDYFYRRRGHQTFSFGSQSYGPRNTIQMYEAVIGDIFK